MSENEFAATIDRFHDAQVALINGNAGPVQEMQSRGDDVTLANPFGGIARGASDVARALAAAAVNTRDGELVAVEVISTVVTPDLAYVVGIERAKARVGGREQVGDLALRATTIFRREEGAWRILHRHADTLVGPQDPASLQR